MSNRKSYTNIAGAQIWTPGLGQIWHVRGNVLLHDYADTRVTDADYGDGFKELLAGGGPTTLTSGDKIVLGPGSFDLVDATMTTANIEIEAHGTILNAASDYDHLLRIEGDNCRVKGLRLIDTIGSNTQDGFGIIVTGDWCELIDCHATGMTGFDAFHGSGFNIAADDVVVDNCQALNCEYAGLFALNSDRLLIDNSIFKNCGLAAHKRTMEIEGSSALEWIKIHNTKCIADVANTGSIINFNRSGTTELVELENVTFIDRDQVSPGVSYNSPNREQQLKVQNVTTARFKGCIFSHGTNSGSGAMISVAVDATVPENIFFEDCLFSSGCLQFYSVRFENLQYKNCHFGVDFNESGYLLGIMPGRMRVEGCTLNVHAGARAFNSTATVVAATDSLYLIGNTFLADKATDVNVADDGGPYLKTVPRKIVSYDNTYNNIGTGDFVVSSDDDLALQLTTNANGDKLWAGSPATLTTVPGEFIGQLTYNTVWPLSSAVKQWIWNGAAWAPYLS